MGKTDAVRHLRDFTQTMMHPETKVFVVRNRWWDGPRKVVACRREDYVWILSAADDEMPIRFATRTWVRSIEDARKVIDEWVKTPDDDVEARHAE